MKSLKEFYFNYYIIFSSFLTISFPINCTHSSEPNSIITTDTLVGIFVDGKWNGNGTGTQSNPFKTIKSGIAALRDSSSDILYIKGGQIYNEENLVINKSGKDESTPIKICPWPKTGNVTIDGEFSNHSIGNQCFIIEIGKKFIKISNSEKDELIITNFENSAIFCRASKTKISSNIQIEGLTLQNNTNSGKSWRGTICFSYTTNLMIRKNKILSAGYCGIWIDFTDGTAANPIVIDSNVITGLFKAGDRNLCSGIIFSHGKNAIISNNDIRYLANGINDNGIYCHDERIDTNNTGNNLLENITIVNNYCVNQIGGGNVTTAGTNVGIIVKGLHHALISKNICGKWRKWGIDVGGGENATESYDIIVEKNLCYNNYCGNIETSGDAGVNGPIVVRNNISYADTTPLDDWHHGFGHHNGGAVPYLGQVNWYNNSHYDSKGCNRGFSVAQILKAVFKNNCCYTNGYRACWIDNTVDTVIMDYNNWYKVGTLAGNGCVRFKGSDYTNEDINNGVISKEKGMEEHGLGKDPLYANPPADMRLKTKSTPSPCIGKGTVLDGFSDDHNSNTRTIPWDIGAFESGV